MLIVDCTVAHLVIKDAVVFGFGTLWVRQKWSQTFQLGLVLDCTEDPIDGSLEWSEAGVNSVDLNSVPEELS